MGLGMDRQEEVLRQFTCHLVQRGATNSATTEISVSDVALLQHLGDLACIEFPVEEQRVDQPNRLNFLFRANRIRHPFRRQVFAFSVHQKTLRIPIGIQQNAPEPKGGPPAELEALLRNPQLTGMDLYR